MCMCLHDLESGHLLEFCTVVPHLAVLAEPAMSLGGLELAFLGLGYLRHPNSLVRNYIFLTVSSPAELSHGLDSPETRLVWASQAPFRTVTPGLHELVSVSSHRLQSPWVTLTFQSRSMDQHCLVLVRNADPQACPRPQSESAFWQGPPLLPPWHGPCCSPWGSQQRAWQSSFAENAPLVPLQRHGFDPWSGNYDPTCRGATEPARHNYWSPRAAMKIPRTTIKTQHTKNKEIKFFLKKKRNSSFVRDTDTDISVLWQRYTDTVDIKERMVHSLWRCLADSGLLTQLWKQSIFSDEFEPYL